MEHILDSPARNTSRTINDAEATDIYPLYQPYEIPILKR